MICGYIGPGIMALPFLFETVGWTLGVPIFVLLCAIHIYTNGLLFNCLDQHEEEFEEKLDYESMMKKYCGTIGMNA